MYSHVRIFIRYLYVGVEWYKLIESIFQIFTRVNKATKDELT